MVDAARVILEAMRVGDVGVVRTLLGDEPSLAQAKDPDGFSLLLVALRWEQAEVAALLRAARPELDLFEAAAIGDMDELRRVCGSSPTAVHALAPDGSTALHYAAFFDRADAVAHLMAAGLGADTVNAEGETALALARRNGAHAAVAVLERA